MATERHVKDVGEDTFERDVVERSREVPVVVDFWAEWCGPCRTLGPAIERAVDARDGAVELAKVDVDANGRLAAAFRVQGIPAVKAFKDGKVVSEFVGAQPPAAIEQFLDGLVPSEAEQLVVAGDEDSLRRAVELEPNNAGAATALARILIARGDLDEATALLGRFPGDFVADGLAARADLQRDPDPDLADAFGAWDDGDHERALERLQSALASTGDQDRRDLLRRTMLAIFNELGVSHPLASEHRRRLAAALN